MPKVRGVKSFSKLRVIDQASFVVTVSAGLAAAIAGAVSWTAPAIAAGVVAAGAPLIGRLASAKIAAIKERIAKAQIDEADQRASAAIARADELRRQLLPRTLSPQQAEVLTDGLRRVAPFTVRVSHNRHEAEPSAYHAQIFSALESAGLDVHWFGGMNNSTVGVEVSGPDGQEKLALMAALTAAQIRFTPITLTDCGVRARGIEVWVGSHPGLQY